MPDLDAGETMEHDLQQLAQRLSAAATHPLQAVVADDVPVRVIYAAIGDVRVVP